MIPCLRCACAYDEPLTRGFCSYCWSQVIQPMSVHVEAKGGPPADATIGLLSATYSMIHAEAKYEAAAIQRIKEDIQRDLYK